MESKCILLCCTTLHFIALHCMVLYCIVWYYIIVWNWIAFMVMYYIVLDHICIAWLRHHWCLHQELSTGRTDNADKCFHISLHFGIQGADADVFYTFLHFSKNQKLINGRIGGGAAALTIPAEKRQNWRLPSHAASLSLQSFTLNPFSMRVSTFVVHPPPFSPLFSKKYCKVWFSPPYSMFHCF